VWEEIGVLWGALRRRTALALESGALSPLATRVEVVEDAGVRFSVRILENIRRKSEAGKTPGANPFLPYDEAMFVADVSRTHVALLNRFNVFEHHVLIVTRRFEDQLAPLTLVDFEALWSCMLEIDGLGFYNAGSTAGASQPHKHMQLVPLPLGPEGHAVPVEPLLAEAGSEPGPVPGLPFSHSVARIDSLDGMPVPEAAASLVGLYGRMVDCLDVADRPYNLMLTRRWMAIVPREIEHFESISVNALGFAGSILVRDPHELQLVKKVGPMTVLRRVARR
jgi:ATP adenylyltransferase